MKNMLLYNYDINIEQYTDYENGILFYIDYIRYYFLKCDEDINSIEQIIVYLNSKNSGYYKVIVNKFGQSFSKDNDKYYVLLKLYGSGNDEVDLFDILNDNIIYNEESNSLKRNDWGFLWSQKVDYLEYQISQLGTSHETILSSFSYYIGMAENAITYFNSLSINENLYLSHRRINYPNVALDFFNPIHLIVDYRVRDIAEYIKSRFWNDDTNLIDDISILLNKNIFSEVEINLLYIRLLFPTFYFDALQEVLEDGASDDIVLPYLDRNKEYESFLRELYDVISKKNKIKKIPWLWNDIKVEN